MGSLNALSKDGAVMAKELGELMRECRLEFDWDQRMAAAFLGTSQARISDLENGKVNVMLSTLIRVFEGYGYDVEITITAKGAQPEEETNE